MLKKKYYTGLQIHEAIDGVVGDYQKAIEIYRRLAKMETDDVAPVVRCKDCKYNYGKEHGGEFNPEDIVCDYWATDGLNDDDFCSYGERSENAD